MKNSGLDTSKVRFANLLLSTGKEFDETEYVEMTDKFLRKQTGQE